MSPVANALMIGKEAITFNDWLNFISVTKYTAWKALQIHPSVQIILGTCTLLMDSWPKLANEKRTPTLKIIQKLFGLTFLLQ